MFIGLGFLYTLAVAIRMIDAWLKNYVYNYLFVMIRMLGVANQVMIMWEDL